MSGGGVENNWRLGGGMDIYIYILFFNNPFLLFLLFLFFLPRILVIMARYNLRF